MANSRPNPSPLKKLVFRINLLLASIIAIVVGLIFGLIGLTFIIGVIIAIALFIYILKFESALRQKDMTEKKKHSILGLISIIFAIAVLIAVLYGFTVLSSLQHWTETGNEQPWDTLFFSTFILGFLGLIAIISGITSFLTKKDKIGLYTILIGVISLLLDGILLISTFARGTI